jgi:hypothetical protein
LQRRQAAIARYAAGEKQVDRIDLKRIDVRDFEDVDWPICGSADWSEGIDCRACGG